MGKQAIPFEIRRFQGRRGRQCTVSESFASMLATGGDPIGRRITEPSSRKGQPNRVFQVIGAVPAVITDVETLNPLVMYLPMAQNPAGASRTIVLHAAGDPRVAIREVMSAIKQLDMAVAPRPMLTIDERLGQQMRPQQFGVFVLGALGTIAVILTVLGIYVRAGPCPDVLVPPAPPAAN